MTSNDYAAYTGFEFVPLHNPGNYSPKMGKDKNQALRTEKFQQNQALFRKYIAIDGALKKKIIMAVEPVLLSPLVDQLTGFGQVSALHMLQHLLLSYGTIDEIDLEKNSVKIMGPYNPTELLALLIEQLEKGRELTGAGGKNNSDTIMVSKRITLLTQKVIFNDDIRKWQHQATDQKTWAKFKIFFHQYHPEQRKAVTIAGKRR